MNGVSDGAGLEVESATRIVDGSENIDHRRREKAGELNVDIVA